MNGKVKKNKVMQVERSINGIAKYIDNLETNTANEIQFYNGMERALSFLEHRPPVYKDVPTTSKKISLKQRIYFYYAYIRFYFKKGAQ